jgi:hypothetical protein
MIELTEQQVHALEHPEVRPPRVLNPKTQQTFVLLPMEEYRRLTEYDANPWTDEEMELLAWEPGARAGWEDMDDYDRYEKKP